MNWRRHRDEQVYNVVTPTEHERQEDKIRAQQRRYFRIMIPCLVLVVFGFFVPAPTPIRVAALCLAAVMPPIAAIVGSNKPY
jgi:Na+/H+ antiporter NhaD/arsenite permease-like protein